MFLLFVVGSVKNNELATKLSDVVGSLPKDLQANVHGSKGTAGASYALAVYLFAPLAIIGRHIVPNLLGVVMVYITLTIPQVILVESFLSFLGLGVQEPMTSWGALVHDGAEDLENAWWMLVFPAAFLALTLFCFNFVGDGLRDALDPKDRR